MISFTVIIPVYNSRETIGRAVECALGQTYPAYEIIVIDDGSADGTAEVVAGFGDKVRLIRQENRGPAAARNRGIDEARGDWVAFLDADDLWLPDKLRLQAGLIGKAPEAGVVFSDWAVVGVDGKLQYNGFDNPAEKFSARDLDAEELGDACFITRWEPFEDLLRCFALHTSTAAVRRDLLEGVRMDERFTWGEDWLFFLDLARVARFGFMDQALVEYRERESGICKQAKLSALESRYAVAKEALTRYGGLKTRQKKLLYPRLSFAGGILGYRILDELGDAKRARRVWREAARLAPGPRSVKLLAQSIAPAWLLKIIRSFKYPQICGRSQKLIGWRK